MGYETEFGIGHLTDTEGYTETNFVSSGLELQNYINSCINEVINQKTESEFSIKIKIVK